MSMFTRQEVSQFDMMLKSEMDKSCFSKLTHDLKTLEFIGGLNQSIAVTSKNNQEEFEHVKNKSLFLKRNNSKTQGNDAWKQQSGVKYIRAEGERMDLTKLCSWFCSVVRIVAMENYFKKIFHKDQILENINILIEILSQDINYDTESKYVEIKRIFGAKEHEDLIEKLKVLSSENLMLLKKIDWIKVENELLKTVFDNCNGQNKLINSD